MDLVISNATVLGESGVYEASIGVSRGRIAAITGPAEAPGGKEVIDASGKLVMPGVIDAHVHMELPVSGTVSSDDFASGTRAAACANCVRRSVVVQPGTPETGIDLSGP